MTNCTRRRLLDSTNFTMKSMAVGGEASEKTSIPAGWRRDLGLGVAWCTVGSRSIHFALDVGLRWRGAAARR